MTDLKQWHKEVCSRDNYTCRACKKDFSADYYFDENGVNQYVCGHHVKTRKAHPELTFSTSNGICVCLECHNKIHKGLINVNNLLGAAGAGGQHTIITIVESGNPPGSTTIGKPDMQDLPEVKHHKFPSGEVIALGAHQKVCKCKKYLVPQGAKTCMACEKKPTMFKEEKKKKKT